MSRHWAIALPSESIDPTHAASLRNGEADLEALTATAWPQVGRVNPQRMVELTAEVRTIIHAARRAAQGNAFDDEPSRFAAVLRSLAESSGSEDR